MRGIIKSWNGPKYCGFILGEDNNEYFLHISDVVNAKKIKSTNIVHFETKDDGGEHLRAINVYKTGHGKHHPFIQDANRLKEVIEKSNEPEKDYRLRDIQMMINYFTNIEDIAQYPDVRQTFRPKGGVNYATSY